MGRDEVYIGTAEERAGMAKPDKNPHESEVGHLSGSAYPAMHDLKVPTENPLTAGEKRSKHLTNIKSLRNQIDLCKNEEHMEILQQSLALEFQQLKAVNSMELKHRPLPVGTSTEATTKDTDPLDDADYV